MKYQTIATIRVHHPYYSSGLCPDVLVAPSDATAALLRGHRCLWKQRNCGADIHIETDNEGGPLVAFSKDQAISFELRSNRPDFGVYTDLTKTAISQNGIPTNGLLKSDTRPNDTKIQFAADLTATNGNGTSIQITFERTAYTWVYYLVTDQPENSSRFSVNFTVNDTKRDWIRNDTAVNDPVHLKLGLKYPVARIVRFNSPTPIPCQESGLRNIGLLYGSSEITQHLENPALTSRCTAVLEEGGKAEIVLFQIIRFIGEQHR